MTFQGAKKSTGRLFDPVTDFVLAVGWAAALAAGSWNDHASWGVAAAVCGGFAAVFLAAPWATSCSHAQGHTITALTRRLLLIPALAILAAILLSSVFARWLAIPAGVSLALEDCLVTGLQAFALVFFLRSLSRWFPLSGCLELLTAIGFTGFLLADHRTRSDQPAWLVDWFIRRGHDPVEALTIAGMAAALIVALLLVGTGRSRTGPRSPGGRLFTLALLVILTVVVTKFVPSPALLPTPPAPPPMESSQPEDPPPPPPPPQVPVLWVEMLDSYHPTPRLKALYFRLAVFDDPSELASSQIGEPDSSEVSAQASGKSGGGNSLGNTEVQETPLSSPAASETTAEPSSAVEKITVGIKAHILKNQELLVSPPTLVAETVATRPIPVGDSRFASSWELRSRVPGHGGVDDLRLGSLRAALGNPQWTEEENTRLKALPQGEDKLSEAGDALLSGIPRMLAEQDIIKLKMALSHSKQSFQPDQAAWQFTAPEEGPPDTRELARRATCLTRATGIACRLAHGLRYPLAEGEGKSTLLLTDQHETWWPEVYLEETGWVPVTFASPDGAGEPPPPQHDLEQMMAASFDTEPVSDEPGPGKLRSGWRTFLIGLAALAALAVLMLLSTTWFLVAAPLVATSKKRAAITAKAADALLAPADLQRCFGETRSEFASRVARTRPTAGRALGRLAAASEAARYEQSPMQRRTAIQCLIPLWGLALTGGLALIGHGLSRCEGASLRRGLQWYPDLLRPSGLFEADNPPPDKLITSSKS